MSCIFTAGAIVVAAVVAGVAATVAARRVLAAFRAHQSRTREERARSLARRLATGRP